MRRAGLFWPAAALAGLGLVGACSQGSGAEEGTSRALYPVGMKHSLCAPSEPHRALTEGFDTFANRGPGPVRIDRVEWPVDGDLKVDSVRVFQREPTDRFATIGLWDGLPQDKLTGSERRAWQRSVQAEGAVVDLADEWEGYLVFVVGLTGTQGEGGPLTVHYTDDDGEKGSATSFVKMRVEPKCSGQPARQ